MRVLVVQNFGDEGLGLLGAALEQAQAEVDVRKPYQGDLFGDAAGHDALVVLGGPQNARDDAGSPYFPELLAMMREYGDSGRSVMGTCLGSQLLARAYGGENIIGGASEFGWCTVSRTQHGAHDPVLAAAPQSFPIFQWHDDTFTLPEGATHLAHNEIARNQAFRIGRAAYGIQFHFEADQAHVRHWRDTFSDVMAEQQPGWLERYSDEAARHGPAADAAGMALARAWVATVPAGAAARQTA